MFLRWVVSKEGMLRLFAGKGVAGNSGRSNLLGTLQVAPVSVLVRWLTLSKTFGALMSLAAVRPRLLRARQEAPLGP